MDVLYKIFGMIGLILFFGLILSLPTWLLWNNALVGAIDGVQQITWLQAWGLQILAASLLKGVEARAK